MGLDENQPAVLQLDAVGGGVVAAMHGGDPAHARNRNAPRCAARAARPPFPALFTRWPPPAYGEDQWNRTAHRADRCGSTCHGAGVGETTPCSPRRTVAWHAGADVVVGFVDPHGRVNTAAQVRGLEVVPRCGYAHRGTALEEMDVDAVLARHPAVALVDELAHAAPGARNPKRWQDVELLLDAGIDVVTTVNVQHLESLNDVVERITGIHRQSARRCPIGSCVRRSRSNWST